MQVLQSLALAVVDYVSFFPNREHWDLFRSILYESNRADKNAETILQYLKVLCYLLFFLLILGGLVFSKISFLTLTSTLGINLLSVQVSCSAKMKNNHNIAPIFSNSDVQLRLLTAWLPYLETGSTLHISFQFMVHIRHWSLITGRGATKWENRRSETFCPPPPPRQGKTLRASPLREWKLFVSPL